MNVFNEIDLLTHYTVKSVSLNDYEAFRAEFEPKIFPNRFDLNITQALSQSEIEKLKKLKINLDNKQQLRLGFFHNDEMIGWSYGFQVSNDTFRMATTGIRNEHQRKGVYSTFLQKLLSFLESEGYQKVVSRHYATDNQVIIPKLRAGFRITGMELTDDFGLLVLLSYLFNQTRVEAMDMRSGLAQPTPGVQSIIRKYD